MLKLILLSLLIGVITPGIAVADNIRPVYLEIEELSAGKIRVIWKVPRGQGLPPGLKPSFPEQFKVIPPLKRVQTTDANVEIWEMLTGGGLAGSRIRIDGLEQTTTDALVRIRLSDGSIHRVVLRPTETTTTIPNYQGSEENPENLPPFGLQMLDRWHYIVLFVAAFLLSLLPGARRRGIVLCTVFLIVGALCGHALGRIPALHHQPTPSKAEAAKILQGLMLNIYRAFMLDRDEDVYDVLARSVSGGYLNEVYLENRERLRLGKTGDAMALVHQLDIRSIDSIHEDTDGRLNIVAHWDVYGSVYHQSHVHYRCNTYTAEVTIKPTESFWKILKIQLLDEQRVL